MKLVDVLLVEDNENDAELTIRALKKNHLANEIIWLKDGQEALDFLFGKIKKEYAIPKVVLLDIKMPKIDGIEVLRRIRMDETIAAMPVVVLTSSKQESDIVESYKLKVNSYIVKPVDFHQFVKCIKELGMYWAVVNTVPGAKS